MKKNNPIRILYLGNDLSQKSKYHSAFATLKSNLIVEGYLLKSSSKKINKISRLLDMVFSVIKNRNQTDYILIDTFSTTAFYFTFITSQLSRFLNLRYIPILHGGSLPERLENSPKMSSLIFSNAYKNISPSNYLKEAFVKKGFKVEQIHNTVNINEFKFKERKILAPKILYVRAFAEIYNPVLAIDVLKKVLDIFPDAELCMVGPDRDGTLSLVEKRIRELSLDKKVKLTGVLPKEEWHKLSEDYDVFINTTNVDNTPVSLIEVMALGLPIVSTNVGGIPFLMDNGRDADLVNPKDAKSMAMAILELLKEPTKANSYSIEGRKKAEKMDWGIVKNDWNKILS